MIELTEETFDDVVIDSSTPVLVDFWAPWCGPCRMVGPVLEQLDEELPGVSVVKLNVDDYPQISSRYGVNSIPTMSLFVDGTIVTTITGAKPKQAIASAIKDYI